MANFDEMSDEKKVKHIAGCIMGAVVEAGMRSQVDPSLVAQALDLVAKEFHEVQAKAEKLVGALEALLKQGKAETVTPENDPAFLQYLERQLEDKRPADSAKNGDEPRTPRHYS